MNDNYNHRAENTKCTQIVRNQDFYCLNTFSGRGSQALDEEGEQYLHNLEVTDEMLGESLVSALNASRTFTIEALKTTDFFYRERRDRVYDEWVRSLMNAYGYKTKRTLFRKMHTCHVYAYDELITIRPSNHYQLEGWGGDNIGEEQYVILSDNCSHEELGAGIKLAFSRCIGRTFS